LGNAEHLVDSVCQLAADLLGGSPNLRLLVTSRELLNIAGEVSWRVPPLQLPPEDAQPELGELLQYDAIQLFATRAVELEASFQLTEANAGFVVAICRRLNGIPLALELTAARVRSMGLGEITT